LKFGSPPSRSAPNSLLEDIKELPRDRAEQSGGCGKRDCAQREAASEERAAGEPGRGSLWTRPPRPFPADLTDPQNSYAIVSETLSDPQRRQMRMIERRKAPRLNALKAAPMMRLDKFERKADPVVSQAALGRLFYHRTYKYYCTSDGGLGCFPSVAFHQARLLAGRLDLRGLSSA
jgi:hypothetical protein